MTTHDILNIGFERSTTNRSNEFTNGIVKVLIEADTVSGIFITNIKVNCINNIDELLYICKKVNTDSASNSNQAV